MQIFLTREVKEKVARLKPESQDLVRKVISDLRGYDNKFTRLYVYLAGDKEVTKGVYMRRLSPSLALFYTISTVADGSPFITIIDVASQAEIASAAAGSPWLAVKDPNRKDQ